MNLRTIKNRKQQLVSKMKRIKKNFTDQSIGVAATEVYADIKRRLHTVVFPVTNNAVAFGFGS